MCQKCCLGPDGQGASCLGARYIFISEVRPSRAFGGDTSNMDTLGYDPNGQAREVPA